MEVMWAPWRMAYIGRGPSDRCIFCVDDGGPQRDLVLATRPAGVVMLNLFPYNSGHLLVAPRRHVARLGDLAPDEYGGLMDMLRASVEILERVLKPQGMNVGINLGATAGAGVADHLHWHAVPRWDGDTNFMPVIGEVKVLPQHLQASYETLKGHFDEWVTRRAT
jgi:ATP adenylyltransferase